MSSFSSSIRHLRRFSTTANPTSAKAPISINTAKNRLRSEYDPDKALEILSSVVSKDSNNHLFSNSRQAQDLTIRRLSKARRFTDIENLIEPQKKDPKITEEPFLSILIRSYGRANMFDHALRTFNQMEELGTPRSVISFNALLAACNYNKKFDQVPKLFDEISHKYSITPDRISYGILIKSLCESGSPEIAYSKIEEMVEKDVEVNTITYTTILDALYKKGSVEEAEKIWKEMIEKGCSLDITAFNVRAMHAQEGKPEDVLALLDEMKLAGLKPDTISYNYLMTCYLKNDMIDDAEKVYKGLEKNECPPNAATFRIFIYHLCKAGDYDKGLMIFNESMKKGKVPSFGTLKILVEGLVKNEKEEEAKGVIKMIKKKFPSNILIAWKNLERNLGLINESESESDAKVAAA